MEQKPATATQKNVASVMFVLLGAGLLVYSGTAIKKAAVVRIKVNGTVSAAKNTNYEAVKRSPQGNIISRSPRFRCSYKATYRDKSGTEYTVNLQESNLFVPIQNGASKKLEYVDSTPSQAYLCCAASKTTTVVVSAIAGCASLLIAVLMYNQGTVTSTPREPVMQNQQRGGGNFMNEMLRM